MLRPVAAIVWAILQSQPAMPAKQARSYAAVVRSEARARHIDPLTIVAIVHHESRWRASAVSRDGEDYGLGQIRARYVGACRKSTASKACAAVRVSLLDGHRNLRLVAAAITRWRETCKRITHRPALFRRWLHGYGGMGRPRQGIMCGMRKTAKGWRDIPVRPALRRIMQRRLWYIRNLSGQS